MPRDPGREGLVATAEHHQPRSRARTNRALRSLARARSGTRRRARAHSSAPPPARPRAPARARALEASLVRLLHSLRAEWAVGSSCSAGWEGEEGRGRRRSAWGRGRAAPAGKGLGRGARPPERADQGDSPGGLRARPGSPLPLQLLSARPFRPSSCSPPGIPGRSGSRGWLGFLFCFILTLSVLFPFQNPQTQERIAPAVPSLAFCPNHIVKLLCESTQL